MNTMVRIKNAARRFHKNEAGMEALQVVMIIAIAAIVLLAVKSQWTSVKEWFDGLVEQITGWDG